LQEHITPRRLADQLYSRHGHDLTVADLLIIRPPVDQQVADVQTVVDDLKPVFERVPKLPTYLLTSNDFTHAFSDNVHISAEGILTEEERRLLLPLLRRRELAEIARRSKAIMQADGATIFRTPSRSYCYRFLRTANVQIDRATMDIFFFWMIPWLRGCQAIIGESWTISAVVLNATRLLARYAPGYTRCKVEVLADYYDGSAGAVAAAESALDRVLPNARGVALCVFSACMTGNAVARLRALVATHCSAELSAVFGSLYNLRPGLEIECLCELSEEFPPGTFEHFPELPAGSEQVVIIDIDRTTYFPSVLTEVEIGVDVSATKLGSQFFRDYGLADIFSIHRNSYIAGQKLRHHAIYTDIERLFAEPTFQGRLREQVTRLDAPPSIVITPPHGPGRTLAQFAADILRSQGQRDVRIFEHLDLVFGPDATERDADLADTIRRMDDRSAILVLDDVSVTGQRLARYSKSLRDLFRGQIHYLIGLARPEQSSAWKVRKRDLKYRGALMPKHTVNFVEFLLLPDWNESCCSWCAEQAIYRNIARSTPELPILLARRSADLAQTETDYGGVPQPFLCHVPEEHLRIGGNSLFAPEGSTPATVYAAVASAIQQLRARSDPAGNLSVPVYPQVKTLRYKDYLGTTFTDAVLRASFLRATHRRELERVSTTAELDRAEKTRSLIVHPQMSEHCITLEFFLSMAMQHLPRVVLTEEEKQLPHLSPIRDVLDLLIKG
jgi:hypothetical protein